MQPIDSLGRFHYHGFRRCPTVSFIKVTVWQGSGGYGLARVRDISHDRVLYK